MKKIVLIFMFILLVTITSAQTNLDFRLDVEEKGFYPNEKIPLEVTIVNRDSTFATRDAELTINIGQRLYTYDLGDLEPGEIFQKEIILPEFPAGTHSIKGEINYTGILDERFIEVSYGSFEVLFPPIERYPRNVYVSSYDLPEKILGGKDYDARITITNDGEVSADLLIEFGSIDEFFTEEATLDSGESKTVEMTVKFDNPGVSLIEARVYTVIDGEKYLLNYRGKKTYVQAERKAKLIFDKVELVNEPDNEINQEDTVKFKIFIKNDGDTATDVNGELSSNIEKINVLDSSISYVTIASKDSVAPSEDTFEIETKGIEIGDYELDLKLSYIDSENREKEIKIPININEGGDTCKKDSECLDTQSCKKNQCTEVECVDGYVKNHKCIKYECVKDSDCKEFYTCDQKLHICKPPECELDLQCEDNEICSLGKCRRAFTMVFTPLGYDSYTKDKYLEYVNEELNFFVSISPLNKVRAHIIDPEVCKEFQCLNACGSCQRDALSCAQKAGLSSVADNVVAIGSKKVQKNWGYCGCAAGIPALSSVSADTCSTTMSHEVGHTLGLYHIDSTGGEGGACLGPNKLDCNDPNKKSDIMGYKRPRDHFGPIAYKYLKEIVLGVFI